MLPVFSAGQLLVLPKSVWKRQQDLNDLTKGVLKEKQRDIRLFPSFDFFTALLDKDKVSNIC